jgi:hypothetical protein
MSGTQRRRSRSSRRSRLVPGRKPSKIATAIGLLFLAAGVCLSVGLAGGAYTSLGVLLLFVGGVTLLVDRTGTVGRRKARSVRRKRSRSSGRRSSKEVWVAPVEVIDMRGPSEASGTEQLDLGRVRTSARSRPARRRRPGPS